MRRIGVKLLTAMLLVTMLVSGYNSAAVSAAASDLGIHVMRHISQETGTTKAAITIQGVPQDAKGLQFDLITSSDIDETSMTWNPKLLAEYAHYQDKTIAGNKIQRTYYIVAKSMPLESNSLYIGGAVYNNTDVKFETSGEVKWLGDKLQVTSLQQAALKIETKYDDSDDSDNNGGSDNNNGSSGEGSDNDQGTPPPTDDKDEPSTEDGDNQEPKPDDNEGETTPDKPVSFLDIDGHWAASSIRYVASKGIMNDTGKDKFEPNVTMTRAMFVQTLFNAEKIWFETNPQGKANAFKDVVEGSWYEEAVNWAVEQGITSGLGNQTFGPHQEISREQMAVMMYKYCQLKGIDLPKMDQVAFKDQDKISSWAKEAVAAIHGAGIMNGLNGNRFEPQAHAKRAEVAAVVERLARYVLSKEA